jgi:hypothetical protein
MTAFDMFRDVLLQVFSKENLIGVALIVLLLFLFSPLIDQYNNKRSSKFYTNPTKDFNLNLWYFGKLIYASTISFTGKQQEDFFELLKGKGGLDYLRHELEELMHGRISETAGFYEDTKSKDWMSLDFDGHIEKHPELVIIAGVKREFYNSLYTSLGFNVSDLKENYFSDKIHINELSSIRVECKVAKLLVNA